MFNICTIGFSPKKLSAVSCGDFNFYFTMNKRQFGNKKAVRGYFVVFRLTVKNL